MKTALTSCLCLAPVLLFASTSGALRDYKAGKYEQALKDYQQLLERNADDARLHFNAGAAAYRDQQLDEAQKQFDAALNSPDLKLQERAYYNRGNTLYYLGEQDPDQKKRMETWKKALQDFESSMKLGPEDKDAKFNHDLVQKRLKELQQQQQKSNQNKDDKDNQDDKDQQKQDQQQSKQDQQKQDQQNQQDQQKQDGSKPDQQDQKQPQNQQSQQGQEDQQKQSQPGKPDEQKPQEQQAAQAKQQDQNQQPEDDQQAQEAAATAAGEMTPKQAARLLDAQKGNEQVMPSKTRKPIDRAKPRKDW